MDISICTSTVTLYKEAKISKEEDKINTKVEDTVVILAL